MQNNFFLLKKFMNLKLVISLLLIVIFACQGGPILLSDLARAQNTIVKVNVGIVMDYHDSWVGRMGLSYINMALSDFYASHGLDYKTRLVLHTREYSNRDVVGPATAGM